MTGLTQGEVLKQQARFGRNIIEAYHKVSPFEILIRQLKSPLIYVLFLAAALSIALEEYRDAAFIMVIVIFNTALGFIQEYRAEKSLESLEKHVSRQTKVLRDGVKQYIDIAEIVPGDIVILEPGVKIPADGEVISAAELTINESLVTGESAPVSKQQGSEVFMGTIVTQGLGSMKVTKTGVDTKYGQIAQSLSDPVNPDTQTTRQLKQVSLFLTVIIFAISVFVIFLGIARGVPLEEIMLTGVALGVGTIPEGLVIAYTVVLALGMNRIMKRNAIVKNQPAAESLGNIDVLCIDKTGTITEGKMSVKVVESDQQEKLLRAIAISNNDANFIDTALKDYVIKQKDSEYIESVQQERIQIFPFSSATKYTGAIDKQNLYMVGSPEKVLDSCSGDKRHWNDLINKLSSQGMRLVAVACKPIQNHKIDRKDFDELEMVGLIGIADPIRPSTIQAFASFQNSGISTKVITGDLKETAEHILTTVGFNLTKDNVISGSELEELKGTREYDLKIMECKLFYRTTPEQKLDIVNLLQSKGLRVGMMGDGVNDSPAIKNAEIGISVDSATDVSKEASDIVLLDSNFETIVSAVEQGRNIFKNLRKIFMFLFGDSLSEVYLIILSLIFYKPLPLLPLQILWINLLEDGLPSISLAFEKAQESYLDKKHKPGKQSALNKKMLGMIIVASLITDTIYFFFYLFFLEHYGYEVAQTMIFAGISISSLLFLFNSKTLDSNIWKEKLFDNPMVNISVLVGFFMVWLAIYGPLNNVLSLTPLSPFLLAFIIALTLGDVAITEAVKWFAHRIEAKHHGHL
ncbi:cation-transporting P-type ATPase [Candidatus Dojkabacteria bacterium]|uniref:Cation-transporting P-type ATPase n=1 Tax=Candidatus Dojkabacteria bacterium TaxID=2099670 RepID=A0A955L116_9BACT|nr:cation-transporting P-type ATPase [Candidatus Dojkabacteria bacterium]